MSGLVIFLIKYVTIFSTQTKQKLSINKYKKIIKSINNAYIKHLLKEEYIIKYKYIKINKQNKADTNICWFLNNLF